MSSLQNYWDKKLGSYDTTTWVDQPSLFAQWAKDYFPGSGKLVELGAGHAQDSRYFASLGYDVTATDFAPVALEFAETKSAGIVFKQVDISQPLPFEDASFEVVYAHLSLHYFDTKTTETLFAEIKRILKSDGILAAFFNSTSDPELTEGKEIEPNFIEINGIYKRFFSPESTREFAKEFEVIIADNEGTTYKDEAIGVRNLIRLIARKP